MNGTSQCTDILASSSEKDGANRKGEVATELPELGKVHLDPFGIAPVSSAWIA